MKLIQTKFLLFICFITIPLALSRETLAMDNLSVSPASIILDGVLPDTTYPVHVNIGRSNTSSTATINITSESQPIKDWFISNPDIPTTFYPGENKIDIPLFISIPKDAIVGRYDGQLNISLIESNDKDSQSFLKNLIAHRIPIEICVTDKTQQKMRVERIQINQAAIEQSNENSNKSIGVLLLKINLTNLGNARTSLKKISIDIYDEAKNNILTRLSTNQEFPLIDPLNSTSAEVIIRGDLPTHGNYIAVIRVFNHFQNKPIFTEQLPLTIKRQLTTQLAQPKNSPIVVKTKPLTFARTYAKLIIATIVAFSISVASIILSIKTKYAKKRHR